MERLDKRGQPSGNIRSKFTQLNGHSLNKTSDCEQMLMSDNMG
jgi:hypothetical protein